MSRPVVRWPLRPTAANGTERGSPPASPRCFASASRAISDAERLRRRASRASAAARSSGSDTVVRFIRAYYTRESPADSEAPGPDRLRHGPSSQPVLDLETSAHAHDPRFAQAARPEPRALDAADLTPRSGTGTRCRASGTSSCASSRRRRSPASAPSSRRPASATKRSARRCRCCRACCSGRSSGAASRRTQ